MTNQKTKAALTAVYKPKRRKKASSLDRKKARAGWIFVLPFLVGFVLIYLPIIYNSVLYSFTQIRPMAGGGFQLSWVGWENYYNAINDTNYLQTLTDGLKQMVLDIPAIVIFSLFMAILSWRRCNPSLLQFMSPARSTVPPHGKPSGKSRFP